VTPALSTRALEKRYSSATALGGVDLDVGEGELVGLLGPNGAGKSTLVKIACGLVRPTRGRAEICGAGRLARRPAPRSATSRSSSASRLVLGRRVARAAPAAGRLVGGERERAELLELVALTRHADRRVEEMSKGMQQRLGIAQALVGAPPLLLLDEPTSALDPAGRRDVRQLLEELRGRGTRVLLNSHLLSEIELVCDRVVILLRGEVVTEGAPAELSKPRGVEIETDEGTRLYDGGREEVPRLVADLVAAGRKVYGVRVLTSTLEDTYLEAVGGETS
jgi:ABC-2 type transport system ATP-binding protein